MTRVLLAALFLVTLGSGAPPLPAAAAPPIAYDWQLEELAPGVWAALQPEAQRFDDANSVIVLGERGALLVDAQSGREAVVALQETLAGITELPLRALVNTHWHGDHTMGNALHRDRYGPGLEILGHVTLLEDVPGRAAGAIDEQRAYFEQELPGARERLAEGVDREGRVMDAETREMAARQIEAAEAWIDRHRDTRFEPLDLAYETALVSDRIGRRIELIHAPGHTRGDTVVWLPEERILVAGDLVDAMPFAGHGAPAQWGRSLRRLLQLDFERVVPGHGPIYGRERVELLAGFFEDLGAQAAAAVDDGLDLEATLARVDIAAWRERLAGSEAAAGFFDQVRDEAVRAAWEEASRTAGR